MKNYSKVLAATLAVSMGLGMIGCGSGSDSKEDSAKGGSASSSSASAKSDSKSKSGDDLSGKLVYWSMWNDTEPQGEVWQEIKDGFEN